MSFEVRMKSKKGFIALRIMCIVMIAAFAGCMLWEPSRAAVMEDGSYKFFVFVAVVFLLFFFYSFYAQNYPRIEVSGQNIVIYQLFRPSKTISLGEITSRAAKADYYDPKRAAVAGALGGAVGGAVLHAMDSASNKKPPEEMIYTYYCGKKRLIAISTRQMENASRFDDMVMNQLKLSGKV